ncbi:hypothetical protein [Luteipulveratus halotolerans]|uniref:Flp pilus-assembly TadG-like N-terminal domain-containing protein n=1 Tax=Luteipulveratus halotolerans TaxID=1631356 RepID=A0A0L6CKU6_9MICO|nr:hypothetical protein [Luteipulveratus halotolerans]KNX38349.1 hypothetical protein VV01_16270 [Luteipulveratus halotolerans]
MMLIPAVAALMAGAMLVLSLTADAFGKHSKTVTSADAASLAAAGSFQTQINGRWNHLRNHPEQLPELLPTLLEATLTDMTDTPRSAAQAQASANDGSLTSLEIRATSGGLEFTAVTRSTAPLKGQSTHATATATARLTFRGGPLCFRGNGVHLGLWMHGRCIGPDDKVLDDLDPQSTPPPSTASPSSSPSSASPTSTDEIPDDLKDVLRRTPRFEAVLVE